MPNHVANRISLRGDPKEIQSMLEAIRSDEFGIGSVDFNKIIPMPESLHIAAGSKTVGGLKAYRDFIEIYTFGHPAEEAQKALENIPIESENAFLRQRTDVARDEWELGKTAWNNIRQYGAPTWYEWCIQNWGTKWNAYGYEPDTDYGSSDVLTFQTAWSAPHPILEKLTERFPRVELEHEWADEDIGANCAERRYFGGEMIDEYIPEGIRAMDFAFEVWDYDPLELGLAKNSTGTDYINIENEDYQLIEIFGKPALFSNERITLKDIPKGLYCYHLRHSDDGSRFCSVETKVGVNHGGSVITKEPLDLGENGYIPLDENTAPSFTGKEQTFGEFMRSVIPQETVAMKFC